MNVRLRIHKHYYPSLGANYKVLYESLVTCEVCVSISFFSNKDHSGKGPRGGGGGGQDPLFPYFG